MSAFGTYLWKEWREQRATVGVLVMALTAGVAALSVALPRSASVSPEAFHCTVGVVLLAAVIALGADLPARERAGAGLHFLERMPMGLGMAFRAKFCLFITGMVLASLFGLALAACATWWRAGTIPEGLLQGWHPWILAAIVAMGLWSFALSAWMPAGALSLPAAVLLLSAAASPGVLAVRESQHLGLGEFLIFLVLSLLGAPASAWASFVIGSRLGRSRRRAALAGLSVAALAFLPTWCWAGAHFTSHLRAPLQVEQALIGSGARYAFLNLGPEAPPHAFGAWHARYQRPTAVIVDLENGSHRFAGARAVSSFVLLPFRWPFDPPLDASRVRLLDREREFLLDSATAMPFEGPLPPASSTFPRPEEFGVQGDGRRFRRIHPAGLGYVLRAHVDGRDIERYLDRKAGMVLDLQDLPTNPHRRPWVVVRHGHWLLHGRDRWYRFDPSTLSTEPLPGIGAVERYESCASDGRILLTSAERLWLFDPESGERWPIAAECDGTVLLLRGTAPDGVVAANGPSFVSFNCQPRGSSPSFSGYGLLDLQKLTLVPVVAYGDGPTRLLHAEGRQAIVLESRTQLVRYDVEKGTREVLFSIEALR